MLESLGEWQQQQKNEEKKYERKEIKINFQIYVDLWSYLILNYSCSLRLRRAQIQLNRDPIESVRFSA